jgi:hypothetical protein
VASQPASVGAVGHVTEAGPVGMGLDLVLRQTYYVTWLERMPYNP